MPHTGHRIEMHAYIMLSIPIPIPDNIHQRINTSLLENIIPKSIQIPLNAKPNKEMATFLDCLEYLIIDNINEAVSI